MSIFDKPPSYAEKTKQIASYVATLVKPLGFRKRRNGFNKKLENGLIHQLSLFTVGSYSSDHGKFYLHAGCYVPETKLYRQNLEDPNWVTDGLCDIRGCFPESYLEISAMAAQPSLIKPQVSAAIKALASVDNYEKIMGWGSNGNEYFLSKPRAFADGGVLFFDIPQPIVKACILLARTDQNSAARVLSWYIKRLKGKENPHFGHIKHVSEWAFQRGLDLDQT